MKYINTPDKTVALLIAVAAVIISIMAMPASAAPPEKVTLCHAAGREGTTQFTTITIAYAAAYGPAGHFNEDGTPQAGHEDDYLGPCEEVPSTTTSTTSTTSTTTSTSTTSTSTSTSTVPATVTTVTLPGTTITAPQTTVTVPATTVTVPATTVTVPTVTLIPPVIEKMPEPTPVSATPEFTG